MDDARRIAALKVLLHRLSAHSAIDAEAERAVLALPGELVPVRTNADLVRTGRTLHHACLVADGLIGRYESLGDGRRQIISLHIPSDFVDLHSLLVPDAPASLQAVCPSRVLNVRHAALHEAIARVPSLAMALWRDTVLDAAILGQSVARVGRRDAYSRMAHLLCEMAVRYGRVGVLDRSSFRFPITQEQLGDVLGLTSVHVNRTLKTLREDDLVEFSSGRVAIRDWPGLQRAADFDPLYLGPPAAKSDAVA